MKHLHFSFMFASQKLADLFDTVFYNLYELWQNVGDEDFMNHMKLASERSQVDRSHKCLVPQMDFRNFDNVLIVD